MSTVAFLSCIPATPQSLRFECEHIPTDPDSSTTRLAQAMICAVSESSRKDLVEEFLATGGNYQGLAEFLDGQCEAERSEEAGC